MHQRRPVARCGTRWKRKRHWPIYFAQRTGRRVKTDNAGGSEARRERREPGSTPNYYLCPGINPVRRERPDDRRSGEARRLDDTAGAFSAPTLRRRRPPTLLCIGWGAGGGPQVADYRWVVYAPKWGTEIPERVLQWSEATLTSTWGQASQASPCPLKMSSGIVRLVLPM